MNKYCSPRAGFVLSAWLPLTAALLALLIAPPLTKAAPPAPVGPSVKQADDKPEEEETPEERRERLKRLAEERRAAAEAEREKERLNAEVEFNKMAKAYMSNRYEQMPEMAKQMRPYTRYLSRGQRSAIKHMEDMSELYRPDWWEGTKKQEKNSFEAEIWGRKFWANYVPTRELGLQAVYPKTEFNPRTGELEVVDLIILVTWKPLMVDSPKPASGRLAKEHGYTLGDIAELIVWHELGHNYITEQLPTSANVELYNKYDKLYSTLHEYYADMSALYHCTPRARRIVLQFRLDELDYYMPDQQHCRAAHGIGSIVLADMLMNPDKWPSVRFPPKVPDKQIEINTIIYVYENLKPEFTVEEDMRLQELAKEYIMKQGERTFKSKGEITLPNRLKYRLMITEDRENQAQRDNWVNGKLDELIKDGRADKMEDVGKYDPPLRDHNRDGGRISIRFRGHNDENDEDAPKRIEVPWDE